MDLKRQILGQFENLTFPGPEENPDMFGTMPEEVYMYIYIYIYIYNMCVCVYI